MALRDASGTIQVAPKLRYVPLDELPWPDRSDLPIESYSRYTRHMVTRVLDRDWVRLATMVASRGCPFECTFCESKNFWGKQIRYRNPVDVVESATWLHCRVRSAYLRPMGVFHDRLRLARAMPIPVAANGPAILPLRRSPVKPTAR